VAPCTTAGCFGRRALGAGVIAAAIGGWPVGFRLQRAISFVAVLRLGWPHAAGRSWFPAAKRG